jgi:hypothetical protein
MNPSRPTRRNKSSRGSARRLRQASAARRRTATRPVFLLEHLNEVPQTSEWECSIVGVQHIGICGIHVPLRDRRCDEVIASRRAVRPLRRESRSTSRGPSPRPCSAPIEEKNGLSAILPQPSLAPALGPTRNAKKTDRVRFAGQPTGARKSACRRLEERLGGDCNL